MLNSEYGFTLIQNYWQSGVNFIVIELGLMKFPSVLYLKSNFYFHSKYKELINTNLKIG